MMATKSQTETNENRKPNQRDLPSTWPDWLREYAEKLDAAIILKWRDEVEAQSRQYAIWYIPRASEMEKETKDQDSFKAWLESLCREQDISLIDPTSDLVDLKLSGKKVFHDHFTKEGHVAFAGTFVKWFIDNASKTSNN